MMNEQSASASSTPAHGTVLVADDERHIVQLIKLYLSNEGFGVETASNGQEALAKINRLHLDLLILDLMMPQVDGWEVCRRVRRDSEVPIIMLTARADDVDKIVGLELGADDYVTKPFNPRELVARVKAVCAGRAKRGRQRRSSRSVTSALTRPGAKSPSPARRSSSV